MPERFDPYYKWLGIPPNEQPPNHYRLFGLATFEEDADVIAAGAARTIRYLRDVAAGPNSDLSQRLLNEAATARNCLLSIDKKAAYDQRLKEQLSPPTQKPPPVPKQPKRQRTAAAAEPAIANSDRPVVVVPSVAGTSHGRGTSATRHAKSRALPPLRIAGVVAIVLVVMVVFLISRNMLDSTSAPVKHEDLQGAIFANHDPRAKTNRNDARKTDLQAKPPVVDTSKRESQNPSDTPMINGTSDDVVDDALSQVNVPPPRPAPMATAIDVDERVPRDGLILWLDAQQSSLLVVDDQDRVSEWTDVIQPSRKGFQSSMEHQPLLIQQSGDFPRLRFTKPQFLEVTEASDFDVQDSFTIIAVARGDQGVLLSKGSSLEEGGFAMWNAVNCFRIGGDLRLDAKDDRPGEFRIRIIVGKPGELSWYIDGKPCGGHDQPHRIEIPQPLRIGRRYRSRGGPQGNFEGELSELLMYNRPLDEVDRIGVEEYLQAKWFAGRVGSHDDAVASASSTDDSPAVSPMIEPEVETEAEATPSAGGFVLRVNIGGDDVVDRQQRVWKKSPDWEGSGFGHENGSRASVAEMKDSIYGTAIRGLTAFRAVVPNGRYIVDLHFSEHWTSDIRRRTFAAAVERKPVLRPPLMFQGPGMGQPFVYRIADCIVADGQLDLEFATFQKDSKSILNAIEIRKVDVAR